MEGGPAQTEGTLRPGDRVLALHGRTLLGIKVSNQILTIITQDMEILIYDL